MTCNLPTIHLAGDFNPADVSVDWIASSRTVVPEVEAAVDDAWRRASARPGVLLFDGPMCRLESWRVEDGRLRLALGPTSYKPFLGTNLTHPELADRFGPGVLANPLGVSPALETSDGHLMLGRRNAKVAYYPGRVHPFAGSVEPPAEEGGAVDVFAEVRRELAEELGLGPADVADVRCTGLAEDRGIRQPELIFRVLATRTRQQVEATLDAAEHSAAWSVPARREAVERATRDPELTPVAVAALLLWGFSRFGREWLDVQLRQ